MRESVVNLVVVAIVKQAVQDSQGVYSKYKNRRAFGAEAISWLQTDGLELLELAKLNSSPLRLWLEKGCPPIEKHAAARRKETAIRAQVQE